VFVEALLFSKWNNVRISVILCVFCFFSFAGAPLLVLVVKLPWLNSWYRTCTARVFRSDSPGEAAQWLARSIRERWGVLWCHSFAFNASRRLSTLVSMLELSLPLPVLLLLRVGGLLRLTTRAILACINWGTRRIVSRSRFETATTQMRIKSFNTSRTFLPYCKNL
jgi:hypothetical protein